jgi:hypothetical protein
VPCSPTRLPSRNPGRHPGTQAPMRAGPGGGQRSDSHLRHLDGAVADSARRRTAPFGPGIWGIDRSTRSRGRGLAVRFCCRRCGTARPCGHGGTERSFATAMSPGPTRGQVAPRLDRRVTRRCQHPVVLLMLASGPEPAAHASALGVEACPPRSASNLIHPERRAGRIGRPGRGMPKHAAALDPGRLSPASVPDLVDRLSC